MQDPTSFSSDVSPITPQPAQTQMNGDKKEILHNLRELIEALDRRVPRLERAGETQIAHDAADLRERAMSLVGRIEAQRVD